jgi:hypothetical protein
MTLPATAAVADASRSASPGGGITVSIDALDSYIEELSAAYWVVNAPSVDIPVILSEPWPEGSVGIPFVSNTQPGSVVFSGGATRRTHTLVYPPAGAKPFYPGWTIKFAYFSLLADQPPGIVRGIPFTLYPVQVQEILPSAGTAGVPCGVDWICALAGILGWPNAICGEAGAAAPTAPITTGVPALYETLRRYRDEVLDMTTSGQYYVNLYDQHSLSIIRAMASEPSLATRIWTKKDPWLQGIEALVNNQGDQFTVTQQMQDDLLELLGAFEQAGSPSLAGMIAQERTRLQLDTIAGQSISEYQTQIETLGGPMAVENRSWGDVKRVYR